MSDTRLDVVETYYQDRLEDLQDTAMDLVAVFSALLSELRTELELHRSHRDKAQFEGESS